MSLEQLLHSSYSPKPSSQHNVLADCLKAIGRKGTNGSEKRVCDIRLLVIWVPKEHVVVNFVRDKLKPVFLDGGDDDTSFCPDSFAVLVL